MNIFKKAAQKAKDYFKDVKNLSRKAKSTIVRKMKKENKVKKTPKSFAPGTLVMFKYDALDASQKFDKSPLCVMLGFSRKTKKNVYGLNLHWLPEKQRVLLASLVVEMLEKKKGKLVYEDVKGLIKKFEGSPILRQYKIRRISQQVIQMEPDQYLAAAAISYAEWHQGE